MAPRPNPRPLQGEEPAPDVRLSVRPRGPRGRPCMCQMLNAVNGSKDQIHRSNVYGFGLSSCAPSLSASLPVSMGCLTRDFPQWRKDRPETLALPPGALCEGKCLRQLLLRSTCGPLLVEILPWGQIYGRRGCVPSAELGRTMRCMRRWPGSPASLWLGAKAFAFLAGSLALRAPRCGPTCDMSTCRSMLASI